MKLTNHNLSKFTPEKLEEALIRELLKLFSIVEILIRFTGTLMKLSL